MNAPATNKIEVSVFGCGLGESILVHMGNNDWIIIDSFIDKAAGKPVALSYLEQIGVDCSLAVKLVVATHWHDDHFKGLANVLEECSSAHFVCSDALQSQDFVHLAGLLKRPENESITSGVSELEKVMGLLGERPAGKRSPIWAIADRPIWTNRGEASQALWDCTVHCLSPSDSAKTLATAEIANLLQQRLDSRGVLVPKQINNNHVSVVLRINVGQLDILLGADLEKTRDPNLGWDVILSSRARLPFKAKFFKVPHHGSITGECASVWEGLLDEPTSVVTSFHRGSVHLPTGADAQRITSNSIDSYLSGPTQLGKHKRPNVVNKTINEAGAKVYKAEGPLGHVCVVLDPINNNVDNVSISGAAVKL